MQIEPPFINNKWVTEEITRKSKCFQSKEIETQHIKICEEKLKQCLQKNI